MPQVSVHPLSFQDENVPGAGVGEGSGLPPFIILGPLFEIQAIWPFWTPLVEPVQQAGLGIMHTGLPQDVVVFWVPGPLKLKFVGIGILE